MGGNEWHTHVEETGFVYPPTHTPFLIQTFLYAAHLKHYSYKFTS